MFLSNNHLHSNTAEKEAQINASQTKTEKVHILLTHKKIQAKVNTTAHMMPVKSLRGKLIKKVSGNVIYQIKFGTPASHFNPSFQEADSGKL